VHEAPFVIKSKTDHIVLCLIYCRSKFGKIMMFSFLTKHFGSGNSYLVPLILVAEILLCLVIVSKVAYTEIDWIAYMQEVTYYINGERNYMNIKGDTGPLVYPAGFLYVFSALYYITDNGTNIPLAQYIFVGVYVLVLGVVLSIYATGRRVPLWCVGLLLLSKRIHSIFVLRMFNDCIAMLFGYIALALFLKSRWRLGCVFYSVAVSVKMNLLLQAPGLLMVLLLSLGWAETFVCLCICAAVQLVAGYPFLSTFPVEYLSRSFEIGRVFTYIWTVNLKFLPEEVFVRKDFGLALLVCTVVVMGLFARKWISENYYVKRFRPQAPEGKVVLRYPESTIVGTRQLSPHFITMALFTSNFIGVAFAKSLHYQFYVWYFHMLPYLLFSDNSKCKDKNRDNDSSVSFVSLLSAMSKLGVMVAIEYAFNVYPSTPVSSAVLQVAHACILVYLYWSPAPSIVPDTEIAAGDDKVSLD
jgi:alpha-1,3-mannosyltransferase